MVIHLPQAAAPAPAANGHHAQATPWLTKPQLKPAECVPEESVGAYGLLRRYGVTAPRQQRIPARILHDERPGAGREDLGAQATTRRPPRHSRSPLPARRGHPVRRFPRRLLQALAAGGRSRRRRAHPLLRRPLHGRERRHPLPAAPEGDPAQSGSGLLDGRHGQGRRRRRRPGRPWPASASATSSQSPT